MKKNNTEKEILGDVLKEKSFSNGERTTSVVLSKYRDFYRVYIDGELFKKTANEMFAVQTFNAI